MKAKRYVYEIATDAKSRFKNNEEVKRTIDSIVQMTEQGHLSNLMGAYYIVTVVDENYWGHNEE